jgi:hypothetical protein
MSLSINLRLETWGPNTISGGYLCYARINSLFKVGKILVSEIIVTTSRTKQSVLLPTIFHFELQLELEHNHGAALHYVLVEPVCTSLTVSYLKTLLLCGYGCL